MPPNLLMKVRLHKRFISAIHGEIEAGQPCDCADGFGRYLVKNGYGEDITPKRKQVRKKQG